MKEACEVCGGSGQISFFKGVSRFLLSCEECPECAGLGYKLPADEEAEKKQKKKGRKRSRKKGKQKEI
ncbi:MAG: hypothetical protein KAJ60_09470 [Desulfobulbaceae bacterium]|nr:hypothetical protein [Desulfobulbaceae bacterium]